MNAAENIKKLVENLDLDVETNAQADRTILNDLFRAQKESRKGKSVPSSATIGGIITARPLTNLAVAAGVILIVLVGVKMLGGLAKEPGDQIVERRQIENTLDAELSEVRQMAAVGDVKGLATMLSQGQFESKLVAANLLAKMGKLPPLGRMPALETLSMHASEKLILESRSGKLILRSTKSEDWLEMTSDVLRVHTDRSARDAKLVRVTYDIRGDAERWKELRNEFANWREERADLERELAGLGEDPAKDVNELRERLAKYNRTLDGMDEAAYVSIENGRLKLSCPFRRRTAFAELRDGLVRVEWHGNIVEAESVTLLLALAPIRTDGPPPPVTGWRDRFDMVYSLDDGEVLRWVRSPFIPERQIYATQELRYYSGTDNPPPPGYLFFRWDGELRNWLLAMSECRLASMLRDIGLNRYEYDGPEKLMMLKLGGDLITLDKAPVEEKLVALKRILTDELGRRIEFEKRTASRDSVIVRGKYKRVPLTGVKRPKNIYVYPDSWRDLSGPEPVSGGGTGSLVEMMQRIGSHFDRPFVFEMENLTDITVSYYNSRSYSFAIANYKSEQEKESILRSVLKNLSKQTSLEFEYAQRDRHVWFITEQNKGK